MKSLKPLGRDGVKEIYMKNILLVLSLGTCLTGSALAQTASGTSTPSSNPPLHDGPPPGGGHMGGMGSLTPEERTELMEAHKAAMAANPDLDAESKDLQEKQKALQEKIKAAMIKADPKVAPIIEKMDAGHQHHDGGPGGAPADKPKPPGAAAH